jgi:rhamnogalacturonyl hydrolase YesR
MNGEFRLTDGTLARNRPQLNTLWLDDMFMGIPALAWMGKYTGDVKYFDEAVKQIRQFAVRMFVPEKYLFMHGWVEAMREHPTFFWGRANGWAIMTLVEVLEVLPENHPGYKDVMTLYRQHVKGLTALQSGEGLWHQLLDRSDSYLETSASAIYTYCIARGINRGWLDALSYGPCVTLSWNAVSQQVNDLGQVTGTCVGTGMAFDPAFYYYRPINVFAAHGYGPVLLAGSEMIALLKKTYPKMNDSAVQFYPEKIDTDRPIFEVNK